MTNPTLPWVADMAVDLLRTQRAHALLLNGPDGIGQLPLALTVAKAWLCEADAAVRDRGLACGHCGACHLVDQRAHPDLRVIVPEALREEAGFHSDEAGAAGDDGKKRKPSREIKVDQVRAALGFGELTAGRGALKVLVVHPAEAVNDVSANALLKTLEEPQGAMRFILTTAAIHQLLPTIRSRCQTVHLAAPEPARAQAWLVAQGVSADDAAVLLSASGGQPLLAQAHQVQGRTAAVWREFPASVARQDAAVFAAWTLPVLVDALQRLCHDLLAVAVGAPPRYFASLASSVPRDRARLLAWSRDLQTLARHAEHPWNAPLSLEAILQRSAEAVRAPDRAATPRGHDHRNVHSGA
jgi:DNA polymerase-3 subunit delta'